MDLHLKDKVVLVTGGSRGIGLAIAEEFLNEGARVFISARNKEEVDAAVAELSGKGAISGCITDVSDVSQIKAMVSKCVTDFGGIDILVNNAGIFPQKNPLEVTSEEWDLVFDINMRGYMFVAQECAKIMAKKGGSMVNITSIAGVIGFPTATSYCATKAGVISLTKSLAMALAPGIRVNAIGPGVIDTAMVKDLLASEQMNQYLMSKTPLKRVGKPEEIAKVAVFVASDASSFMTGTTVFVDGGWLTG